MRTSACLHFWIKKDTILGLRSRFEGPSHLEKPLEFRIGQHAHSSIRIQEGQPRIHRQISPLIDLRSP
jgi:hypothetical protein